MNKAMAPLFLALLAGAASGQAPASGPASAPSEADRLAAESLRNSAFSLVHSAGAVARARRLVAVVQFADRLAGSDGRTQWMLAGIYETQGRFAAAADAVETCLASRPGDYALALRGLRLRAQSLKDRPDEMKAFLRSVAGRNDLSGPLRAEAAVQLAQIVQPVDEDQARQFYDQALTLDESNPVALNARLALQKDPSPVERMRVMLALLRGNPMAVSVAHDAAVLLDGLGLYEPALELFAHTYDVARQAGGEESISADFFVNYFNALLDAGKAAEALERFAPLAGRFRDSLDFRSLLIEAYQAQGRKDLADPIVQAMEREYILKEPTAGVSASFATELAWFYLITLPRPKSALTYARQANLLKGDSPVVQRILGAAELASGEKDLVESGVNRLRKLQDWDIYAAAFLAEHDFSVHDAASGKAAIEAGSAVGQGGPAFRRLAAIARAHQVAIPPAKDADAVRTLANAFDRQILALARQPEKHLRVAVLPKAEKIVPGEAVEVEVVLTNTGSIALPLGDWGLFSPVVAMRASVAGDASGGFANLPLATLPAPRRLGPGEKVSCEVRLDVGKLAEFLAAHPLEDLTLTVSGMLDPVQRGQTFGSAVPTVAVTPGRIIRTGLMGSFDRSNPEVWRATWQRCLGVIVRDMKYGKIPERMRAARQVGSLLTLARDVEGGKAKLPAQLAEAFSKPVHLSMLQAVLRDSSDVVRAEMIAALGTVRLDEAIVSLLAPSVQDASGLVRFRLAELLGTSGLPGQETILDFLAQDKYDRVAQMASALLQERRK